MAEDYSWDQSLKAIYATLVRNPPDSPHYQKLAVLAQLKASEVSEDSARAMTAYTKWVMVLTWFIAIGTVAQAVFVALEYFSHPAH